MLLHSRLICSGFLRVLLFCPGPAAPLQVPASAALLLLLFLLLAFYFTIKLSLCALERIKRFSLRRRPRLRPCRPCPAFQSQSLRAHCILGEALLHGRPALGL